MEKRLSASRFLKTCRREATDCTPIWFMRQAGRTLPGYRKLRERHSVLDIAKTPELATQVALEPVERFGVDAAILFADIMLPLEPMGVRFQIKDEVGPIIEKPLREHSAVDALRPIDPERDLGFLLETIRTLRRELDGKVPLIGFSGAPFTLACYLVEGQPSRTYAELKAFLYREERTWHALMEKLTAMVSVYLRAQIQAGVEAVQLFDSWVGCLAPEDYRQFVLPYSREIFRSVNETGVPSIHFGTETSTLLELLQEAGGDVMGIDWRIPLDQAWARLGTDVAIQGNLDPAVLLGPTELVLERARKVLRQAAGHPGHIFNLGHGILPGSPVENVAALVEFVHQQTRQHPQQGPTAL